MVRITKVHTGGGDGVKPLLSTVLVSERNIKGLQYTAPLTKLILPLEWLEWRFQDLLCLWRFAIMQTSC